MVYLAETSYLKWLFFSPGSTFHLWALCQFTTESIDNDCAVVFWAKLNQGNEVARQNISKGMWVVSRVRIDIFLATKIEGTDPGASFWDQRPSQHPAVASPQQIDRMPSGKPRFELAMGNVSKFL